MIQSGFHFIVRSNSKEVVLNVAGGEAVVRGASTKIPLQRSWVDVPGDDWVEADPSCTKKASSSFKEK